MLKLACRQTVQVEWWQLKAALIGRRRCEVVCTHTVNKFAAYRNDRDWQGVSFGEVLIFDHEEARLLVGKRQDSDPMTVQDFPCLPEQDVKSPEFRLHRRAWPSLALNSQRFAVICEHSSRQSLVTCGVSEKLEGKGEGACPPAVHFVGDETCLPGDRDIGG